MTVINRTIVSSKTDEFQMNGFESGDQYGASLLPLSGGGFAIVYGNHFSSTDSLALTIFSADGEPVETESGAYTLPYSGSALGVQMYGEPLIAENSDGSILLRWISDNSSWQDKVLMTASVSSDGAIERPQSLVSNTLFFGNAALAVGANGQQHTILQDEVFESLYLNVKTQDGSHLNIFSVASGFVNYQNVDIAALSDGKMLIAATEVSDDGTNPIHLQFRQSSGLSEGAFFVIDPVGPSDDDEEIELAALPGEGFALAYASTYENGTGVTLRIFDDLDNNPDGITVRADSNFAATESDVEVTALPNGWVVVSWTSESDGQSDVYVRIYDQKGTAKSDALLVSSGQSDAVDPSLAALTDGSLVVSWTDSRGDSDGDAIRGTILEIVNRATGDAGNNQLNGSDIADVLKGNGGKDKLFGLAGNDTLNGGQGNDSLKGGAGNDVLRGGNGSDLALFTGTEDAVVRLGSTKAQNTGYGSDRLIGIERVRTGSGNDSVSGNGEANQLETGKGRDRLYGKGGNDELRGGAGHDTLWGGRGEDVLLGDNGRDVLDGGKGNDLLIGGQGSDIFVFAKGDGLDKISDFEIGVDKIHIANGASNLGKLTFDQDGDDVVLSFRNVEIEIEGALVSDLQDPGNFIF